MMGGQENGVLNIMRIIGLMQQPVLLYGKTLYGMNQ